MSYHTWTIDGFGICVNTIADKMYFSKEADEEKVVRVCQCVDKAKEFSKVFSTWVNEYDCACFSDFMEYEDNDCFYGIGAILKEIIREVYDVTLTLCDDFNGTQYLLFEPYYPWCKVTDTERNMTKEKLQEMFNLFAQILIGEDIICDYYSVENGG